MDGHVQALAATVELAIPHYTSAAIFSVTKGGSSVSFQRNLKLLLVRVTILKHTLAASSGV